MFSHFHRHKGEHQSITKYCVHILFFLSQCCWIDLGTDNKIRQMISQMMDELLFYPIKMNIFAKSQQWTCNYATCNIQLISLKEQFNDNKSSQTVGINKKRQILTSPFHDQYNIILKFSKLSASSSSSRISKTSQINCQYFELIGGKEVCNRLKSMGMLTKTMHNENSCFWVWWSVFSEVESNLRHFCVDVLFEYCICFCFKLADKFLLGDHTILIKMMTSFNVQRK